MNEVAISMSLFNRVELTKQTIDNLFNNAGVNFDFFCCDDNSSDRTLAYLNELSPYGYCNSITVVGNKEQNGKTKNINRFLRGQYKDQKYSYFGIMDNDVILPKKWLSNSISILERYHEVSLCSVLVEPNLLSRYPNQYKISESYISAGIIGGACLIWGGVVKNKVGVFCEDYGLYGQEDADFTLRVRLSGGLTVCLNDLGSHIGDDTDALDSGTSSEESKNYRIFKTNNFNKSLPLLNLKIKDYISGKESILIT